MTDVLADRLTIAMAEAARSGRAMPLAPSNMAFSWRDLWATAKAGERFLEARASDKGFGGFKTLIGAPYRKRLAHVRSYSAKDPFVGDLSP